jgi:hypothetical protein
MSAESGKKTGPTAVKARPPWLRALGAGSPPENLRIAEVSHRLVEVFKHDSWAATALYEGPGAKLRVVKLHRQASAFGIPLRWLGRYTARNEKKLLERLANLRGVPCLAGPVLINGELVDHAVAREYVPGHPLANRESVPDTFFPELQQLLQRMHRRRVVYVDLHKRENIIVDNSGYPCLIDFQISIAWPKWLPLGPLFETFRKSDEYHLMKHWRRCRPDQCGEEANQLKARIPWWIQAHRVVARPIRELRRRVLVRVGVRSGKGRVETEVFAEHALRDIRQPGERAA